MASVSGRLIIRPTYNGAVQDWDSNDYTRVDENIVRPPSALYEGDGQSCSADDKVFFAMCQW